MMEGIPQDSVAVDIDCHRMTQESNVMEGISQDSVAVDIDWHSCHSSQTELSWLDWVDSIDSRRRESKFKMAAIAHSSSISTVSAAFKVSDGPLFKPRTISIGPVHYGTLDDGDHKWRHLDDFLDRQCENSSVNYLIFLGQIENEIRTCYEIDINVSKFDRRSFLEMMLLDGCFIIELFFKAMDGKNENVPLHHFFKNVARDLILLENQIPFFVLQRLFDVMNNGYDGPSLAERALHFFGRFLNIHYSYDQKFHPQHLLHLLHHCCFPLSAETEKTNYAEKGKTKNFRVAIPCASELQYAGFTFKKGNGKYHFDIEFRNGVIKISPFVLDEYACSLFCNLLAFEQCYRFCHKNIMMYIHFMACLIRTPTDFEILTREEIICNHLGTDVMVIRFFKRLVSQEALFDKYYYYHVNDVCYAINQYYNPIFRRWRARLYLIYRNQPWAIVTVGVAVLLQLLALIQPLFMLNKN